MTCSLRRFAFVRNATVPHLVMQQAPEKWLTIFRSPRCPAKEWRVSTSHVARRRVSRRPPTLLFQFHRRCSLSDQCFEPRIIPQIVPSWVEFQFAISRRGRLLQQPRQLFDRCILVSDPPLNLRLHTGVGGTFGGI